MLISPGTKPFYFKFDATFRENILTRKVEWRLPGLSEFTFIRTYARKKDNGKLENWNECVVRVIEGMFTILKTHAKANHVVWDEDKAQRLSQEAAERMFIFKWLPPGRGLWMMGTNFIWDRGGAALQNCAFVSTELMGMSRTETVLPFKFLMDMSMLGVGVGFDTKGADNEILVHGYSFDRENFIVADSREGWVELIGKIIENGIYGGARVIPDTSQVREAGLPIKGFGGVSSGPEPLIRAAYGIADILENRKNNHLCSTDITDIQNLIGKCVVAGNVRRSAEIAFSEPDDDRFLTMKNFGEHAVEMGMRAPEELKEISTQDYHDYNENLWDTRNNLAKSIVEKYRSYDWSYKFGGWRWASNNSLFAKVGMNYKKYEKSIKEAGEPGFAWLDVMRRFGRMKDPENNLDHRVKGGNPCFTGNTLIAVADGRGAVSIAQLAYENQDVPVYSVNSDTGMVEIKWGRNPRMTRDNAELVEIEFDSGHKLRVTPDHKMLLLNGGSIKAKDLKSGDSVPRFLKGLEKARPDGIPYLQMHTNTRDMKDGRVFEDRLIAKFFDSTSYETLYDENKHNGWLKGGLVVHHKDYNHLNNAPDNLVWMTFKDHSKLHGDVDQRGENNSMYGKVHSAETKVKIGKKTLERTADPEFCQKLSESHTEAHRLAYSINMKRQKEEWDRAYYEEQMKTTDIPHMMIDGHLHAIRNCIVCNHKMILPWSKRHGVFCSNDCHYSHLAQSDNRKDRQREVFKDRARNTLHEQISVYHELNQSLGRKPLKKEWESACRETGIPFRLNPHSTNPNVPKSFQDLQKRATIYNHKVIAVRKLDITEPVYNLTVDDNYTFGIVLSFNEKEKNCDGIFTANCLEQSLESYELCCLVENFPAYHDDYWDFQRTLKFSYLYAKTVTLMSTHFDRTNSVIIRNRRIGCSMSGIVDAISAIGRTHFMHEFCGKGYDYIKYIDQKYSDWLGIPRSIKKTSVKPSGTTSLVAGVFGPGVHFPKMKSGYRLIRVALNSDLVPLLRAANYRVEPAVADPLHTVVVYFPWLTPQNIIAEEETTIWEKFKMAADLQYWWADNQVSCTVEFTAEEANKNEISRCLEAFDGQLKGISLLPKAEGTYPQMPYTSAPRDEVVAYQQQLRPLDFTVLTHEGENADANRFCDSSGCVF